MSNLVSAFQTAWKDVKSQFTKVDTYLQANAPKIQAAVTTATGVAGALDPALAPFLAAFSSVEQSVFGELLATVHSGAAVVNASSGAAAVTLSAGLYSSVKSIVDTLSTHPAVVAAAAASPAK